MDINAVYELRERLKTAAVAGTGLVGEDFRLRRAVEQMAPLSKASPVFKRICQMAERVIAPDCEDRAEAVLDTLSLVDAVLCTQGGLLKEGTWRAIDRPNGEERVFTQIPYSRMAPVLEAFKGTGGGRYAVLRDARQEQPEIFKDYRIKNLMVKALGDSYSDISDMAARWLEEEGPGIIPLLKQGFRPDGKREMARRIEVIEAVGAERENEFYIQALSGAGKEVKEAAIRALRHCSGNEQLLTELAKTEKGKLKEAALCSLAHMEGTEAAEYWKKQMKKNQVKAAEYLTDSGTQWASDLIAEYLNQWLDTYDRSEIPFKELKQEDKNVLFTLWQAAEGKDSPAICACYRRIYPILPKKTEEVLWNSLIKRQSPGLCQAAEELYESFGDGVLQCVFWIDLMTRIPEQVYDRFSHYLEPEGLAGAVKRMGKAKPDPMGIYRVFMHIRYEEQEGGYVVYRESWESPLRFQTKVARLGQGIDLRWYGLMLKSKDRFDQSFRKRVRSSYDNSYDAMVAGLFREDIEGLKEEYGKYFYQGARLRGTVAADVRMLKRCGWTDYRGLLALTGKKSDQVMTYEVRELLEELPMTGRELAEELDQLLKGYGKKAKMGVGILEMWREKLRSGTDVRDL